MDFAFEKVCMEVHLLMLSCCCVPFGDGGKDNTYGQHGESMVISRSAAPTRVYTKEVLQLAPKGGCRLGEKHRKKTTREDPCEKDC